jgi:isopentenyl-diphosphate Delta-isomerase
MHIIKVDSKDNDLGSVEKLEAHVKGVLHRAFSVFIFNRKGELLLQKRSDAKYHSGGLWSNTCCSHPRPGKELAEEAKARLREEMGLECDLVEAFSFTYFARLGELTEHEYDHVFVGRTDMDPSPNEEEVAEWTWVPTQKLREDIGNDPDAYTPWLRASLQLVLDTMPLEKDRSRSSSD